MGGVQDLGRTGMMRYGISHGSAADPMAMQLANLLRGNSPDNPVLKVALIGPSIEFQCDISVAIAGHSLNRASPERPSPAIRSFRSSAVTPSTLAA